MVENLSVKTPFSNIGDVQSKYVGDNAALRNWYKFKNANIKRNMYGDGPVYGDDEFPEIYS